MKFKTNEKIKWTSLELEGLLEDDDSCVHYTRTLKHLALHPFHLKDLRKSLNEILISKLNTYDVEYVYTITSHIFYDIFKLNVTFTVHFNIFLQLLADFLCTVQKFINKRKIKSVVVHKSFFYIFH